MYTLGPGESVSLTWEVEVKEVGPFVTGCDVFVYADQVDRIELAIRGVGIQPKDPTHDRAKP